MESPWRLLLLVSAFLTPILPWAGRNYFEVAMESEKRNGTIGVTSDEAGKPVKDPYAGVEVVFIKGGCYEMGDAVGDGITDEKPIHVVCVDDFYLGKYEATQRQWTTVMGNSPSVFLEGENLPVESVSWVDVQQFIERLNSKTGRRYRLPTEAEWEYAARSGGKREKYSGTSQEGDLQQFAWYTISSGNEPHQVGQKKPNALGLYDMSGNVWEWCSDWYGENYYKNSSRNNPTGPDQGTYRVVRGGSWWDGPVVVRTTFRHGIDPSRGRVSVGFRLGLSAQ